MTLAQRYRQLRRLWYRFFEGDQKALERLIELEVEDFIMAFEKLQAVVDDARAAFARLQAAAAAGNSAAIDAAVNAALASADADAAAIVQPLHDDIAAVAPVEPQGDPGAPQATQSA